MGELNSIGLYGGTFDPVHLGHLMVARAALEELSLDRLVFVPAAQSPFKPGIEPTPADVRLQMLRTALAGWSNCVVDDREIRRGSVSFTIDTVRHYVASHPHARLHYIIGEDHLATLPSWKEADQLAALIRFAVVPRPGEIHHPLPAPFQGTRLSGFPIDAASSVIRQRVNQGRPVDHLVPPLVAERIRNNRLYL